MAGARNKPAGGKPVVMVAVEPIKFDRKRVEPGGELTVPSDLADELEQQGAAVRKGAAEAKAEAEAKAKAEAEAKAKAEAEAKAKAEAEATPAADAAQGTLLAPPAP